MSKKSPYYPGLVIRQLTILERGETIKQATTWKVQCSCGVVFNIMSGNLRKQQACRKCADQISAEKLKHNLTGKRFGKLIVIEEDINKKKTSKDGARKYIYWRCLCDCGNFSSPRSSSLVGGDAKSCGCGELENNIKYAVMSRKAPGESIYNTILKNNITGALKRNLTWELSNEEVKELFSSNCFYCNAVPRKSKANPNCYGDFYYNGIDRVDNTKGYILTNCVACCTDCNKAKLTKTEQEFYEFISRVFNHLKSLNKVS